MTEVLCPQCLGPTRALLTTATAVRHVCLSIGCDEPPFDMELDHYDDERPTLRLIPAPQDTTRDLRAPLDA